MPTPTATPTGASINPAGGDNVILTNVSYNTSNDHVVNMTLRNNGSVPAQMERARIPFYDGSQNSQQTFNSYGRLEDNTADELVFGDQREPVDSNITIPAGETTNVSVKFYDKDDNQLKGLGGDFFILRVEYDDAPFATYYVAIPKS